MNETKYLPVEFMVESLSQREVVVTFEKAIIAIDLLAKEGFAPSCWEGWLLFSNGSKGHSMLHQGTEEILQNQNETWNEFTLRAREYFVETATKSQKEFVASPEKPDSKLFFCLSFAREEK